MSIGLVSMYKKFQSNLIGSFWETVKTKVRKKKKMNNNNNNTEFNKFKGVQDVILNANKLKKT